MPLFHCVDLQLEQRFGSVLLSGSHAWPHLSQTGMSRCSIAIGLAGVLMGHGIYEGEMSARWTVLFTESLNKHALIYLDYGAFEDLAMASGNHKPL